MDCHCKDHLPGEWHSHDECDCAQHEYPTYSFVLTKIMDEDPGAGTVYISPAFMESLELSEGDPVEILGPESLVVQARTHPNRWMDARMIALDRHSVEKANGRLFGTVKLRKAICREMGALILEVPPEAAITRIQLRAMLETIQGSVLVGRDYVVVKTDRGEAIRLRIVSIEPDDASRVSRSTNIRLVDVKGEDYLSRSDTTFEDVGGLDEAVRKVREVVQLPLRHPEIFERLGIDPPRGVLLHGPSGTGKTLIARAVAGDTGCYFKSIMGTEIMDKHYGESEAKLRAAFEDAYQNAPAIIFIDEIDALAPRRDTAEGEVERRVTAQLLALMDGMVDRGQVIVLAASNLPNALDHALRRPGRFDREILIGVPDQNGRRAILEIHTRHMPLRKVHLDELAEKTHGFVGADIMALCQEAAFKALRRILPGLEDTEQVLSEDFLEGIEVEMEDFEEALKEMRPASSRNFELDLKDAGWERIAGYTSETEFLKEFVLWPLKNISYLSGIGVTHPEGLLLTGPPGVGKTLMARSLAKESGFNVIEIRGPELISKYMGESERNVRELFRQAREMAPTAVILDNVDSMTSSGWSDAKVIDRVVNQLVLEMNAISTDKPVMVVATAHRAENMPPALKATGKFGTELSLKLPSVQNRKLIFQMYLNKGNVCFSGDLSRAADNSQGLTAGDIEGVCRRVILQAAKNTLQADPSATCEISILEDDLIKMLDRWKLAAGIG
jgi:transitional endoplasmic reticulum ATPase